MSKSIYLRPGQRNPKLMVEGMRRQQIKDGRVGEAEERYLKMLKQKAKDERDQPILDEKKARKLKVSFPVDNPQSPVIQQQE